MTAFISPWIIGSVIIVVLFIIVFLAVLVLFRINGQDFNDEPQEKKEDEPTTPP